MSLVTFTEDTSKSIGQSQRTIQRKTEIGNAITDEDAEKLKDTKVASNQNELMKITKLEPETKKEVIEKIAAGEASSVKEAVKQKEIEDRIKSVTVSKSADVPVYLGSAPDVLKTLEANSIDLVLTDPPYGVSYADSRQSFNPDYKDDAEYALELLDATCREHQKNRRVAYEPTRYQGLTLTPLLLNKAYIGIRMIEADYKKIEGILPIPSHTQLLYSTCSDTKINLIYEIKHNLHTLKQYQWLSDIKLIWKKNIIVDYEYISEFYINEYTTSSGASYALYELTNAFKSEFIKYPKPYYPATTKELYKRLVWFTIRAYKKELLTLEIVYATALRMNRAFERVDRLQDKELYKKAFMAYSFVLEHQDRFITKSKQELKKIKRENGIKRGKQKKQERDLNIKRVKEVMHSHIKPNGKPNITTISKELKLSRVTVTKATKILLMMLLIFWIKGTLEFTQEYQIRAKAFYGYTIIPSAYFTLLCLIKL